MKEDYKKIMKLIDKNKYFYEVGLIKREEYASNCLIFARKINSLLLQNERDVLQNFFLDEFSLAKFKISVSILKAVPN